MAWHVLIGRPLIYGGWRLVLAESLRVPRHGMIVGNHIEGSNGMAERAALVRE